MKPVAIRRAGATPAALLGRVICHDVRDAGGKVAIDKGRTLDGDAAARLLGLPWEEVHLLELEDGDLHEERAGARVSAAAAGPGVEVKGYVGGQWALTAARRGLCRVKSEVLGAVNALAGMSVFTLWDLVPVDAGETVAKAKITPLAIGEALVKQAEERAWAAGGLVRVDAFAPRVVGAVAREHLEARQRQRFEASLTEKLDWFGSRLLPVRYPAADQTAVAADMTALLDEGAEVLIAAGAGSLDPLDPVFAGLARLGGRMERHGAPAHPGSLLWVAELRGRPVLGMPACGMFSQATTFDLVLPRLLTGDRVDNAAVAELGHGGLLSRESAYRFPPYRKSAIRGELGTEMALYSDVIRERFRQPRFRGRLEAPDAVFEDVNPLCGDRIRIEGRVYEGRLTDARFSGDSCAIAAAAADLLIESAVGRSVDEIHALGVADLLERLEADIRPSRMKCVALPLTVLHGRSRAKRWPDERLREEAQPPKQRESWTLTQIERLREEAQPPNQRESRTLSQIERLREEAKTAQPKRIPDSYSNGALRHDEIQRSPQSGDVMSMADLTRPDFPILERVVNGRPLVFLDSAASSQKPASVLEAMTRYYQRSHANVHRSIHTLGEEATELYESARDAVRGFIGAASREEIIFTRGTTEGVNLVAQAIGRTLVPGDEIIVTEMEHHSNLIPWQMLCRDRGARLLAVPVLDGAHLDLATFDRLLSPRTRVVAFAHVGNVLGTINPVVEMTRRAHAAGALVLVDGAQAVPHLPLDMAALGVDFYVFSGHKMLGPTGIGVLYGRRPVMETLEPAWGGGEMIKEVWIDHAQWNDLPWRFEPGTPPIAPAVGLHAAIEYLDKLGMTRVAAHEQVITAQCLDALAAIDGVTVYGPQNPELKGAVVAFNVDGIHPHDGAALLDQRGIAVRAGHHCAQPLMKRLGITGTLRASFSVYTSQTDIDQLATAVAVIKRDL